MMHYWSGLIQPAVVNKLVRQIAPIFSIVIKYSATNLRKKHLKKVINAGLLNYKFPVLFRHNVEHTDNATITAKLLLFTK